MQLQIFGAFSTVLITLHASQVRVCKSFSRRQLFRIHSFAASGDATLPLPPQQASGRNLINGGGGGESGSRLGLRSEQPASISSRQRGGIGGGALLYVKRALGCGGRALKAAKWIS